MKTYRLVTILVLLSFLLFLPSPITAQPLPASGDASGAALRGAAHQPAVLDSWQTATFPPNPEFQYARHDGAFVPGPALAPWANKIYFPGGRTSPPTEAPHIWMFDPAEQTYTDTGADVVEDVSNYNANLVFDDGTGRGPAIYVIGGTDKDHGGASIGMVQRYYPVTNEAESLPIADNWNGMVGGSRVAAIGTAVVDDIIYVYGGWETSAPPYFSAETWAFDPNQPSGSRWTNLGLPLNTPRSYILSAVVGAKIYAIGGVGSYDSGLGELDPTDAVEVLDTANLAAGWTVLAPMPIPGGEGRAFGFSADTLGGNYPWEGKIYTVASNDWAAVSGEFMVYDIATNTWDDTLPELPTPRADLAGSYVPLCTTDPQDGMPGMWTFGGRVNESCDPPLGPAEYYSFETNICACVPFSGVSIAGPAQLAVGEVGTFIANGEPLEASAPATVQWSVGGTNPVLNYSWSVPGLYTLEVTATNCEGSSVVNASLDVEVYAGLAGVDIEGPASVVAGETVTYTAVITPPDATPPIVFLWGNGATGEQAQYTFGEVGTYQVEVTATNMGGAFVVTDTLDVLVEPVPCDPLDGVDFSWAPEAPVPGGEVLFEASFITGTEPVTFDWNFGDGTTGAGITATHTYTATRDFTVTLTAANECSSVPVVKVITIGEPCEEPDGAAIALPDEVFLGVEAVFEGSVVTGTEPLTFDWLITDAFTATPDITGTGQSFAYTFEALGTYTVTLTVTNACGTATATATFTVVPPVFKAYLPVILRATAP